MAKQKKAVTRRQFVRAMAGSLGLAGSGFLRNIQAQTPRPNIVFIMADDLGYADVSSYGQRDYTTPNIDRIALEGTRFTQGYSNSASCTPTRVGLITGRYQMRIPIGLQEPLNATSKGIGLSPGHPTLPSLLKKLGYGTTLVGKWHLGTLPDFSPLKSGYDNFFGAFGGTTDYFNHGSKSATPLYEQEVPVDRVGYVTNLFGDRAVQTIEGYAKSKQPFLLSMHFNAPHYPWQGPDDEAESKRIKALIHRDGGSQKTYAAMVQSMDANIGRILQALDVNRLAQNTIVVFTSDNGGERFSMTWPFSGMKNELLEGGLRIPSIVRWPGRIPAGRVSDQVMISMDWLPTLLAAAGSAPDPAYPSDGVNLLPILTGNAASYPRKLFWRYKVAAQQAVRDGNMKYLRIAGNEFLFNVVEDPRERANLKDRQKEVFERLKKDWEAWDSTMLPERTQPAVFQNSGSNVADHYGVVNPPKPPAR